MSGEGMHRRSLLKGAGLITVVAAAGGVWRAYDQGVFSVGEGLPFEPWKNWRTPAAEGSILALVRAAILAACPHNTQPWLFKATDSGIELQSDTKRNLGMFDPFLREMHIGLGCALENLMLAAPASGYSASTILLPGRLGPIPARPEPEPVAGIALTRGLRQESNLYRAIPRRHTNRGPYDRNKLISPEALESLSRLGADETDVKVFLFATEREVRRLGEILVGATELIVSDASMMNASEQWMRQRASDVKQYRDGLTLDCMGLSPPMTVIAKVLPAQSAETTHRYWLNQTRDVHATTSPLFGVIAIRDRYDAEQNLRAGRIWQRIHLWATTQRLAAQPTNQPMEIMDRERILHKDPSQAAVLTEVLGDATWQPTFMFRMGYPLQAAPPSPRRSIQDVII